MSVITETLMISNLALAIFFTFLGIGFFAVLSVMMLTRPREMREDQYREGGEFDGHIDVKKWNKEG